MERALSLGGDPLCAGHGGPQTEEQPEQDSVLDTLPGGPSTAQGGRSYGKQAAEDAVCLSKGVRTRGKGGRKL